VFAPPLPCLLDLVVDFLQWRLRPLGQAGPGREVVRVRHQDAWFRFHYFHHSREQPQGQGGTLPRFGVPPLELGRIFVLVVPLRRVIPDSHALADLFTFWSDTAEGAHVG